MTAPISLAIELDGDGAHPAAWRAVTHPPSALFSGKRVKALVQEAEKAGFAIATFNGDHLPPAAQPNITARIDPLQQAAFAGPLTSRIGLVPTVEVTFVEPFHVANELSSLDHVSRGRGGWIVAANGSAEAAAAFGRDAITDPVALSREASDVIEVNRRLWDSWEDDAVIRDTTTWRYIDRDKLHYVDFKGETFSVKGPSYVPRPPQGQLVIFSHEGLVEPGEVDVTIVGGSSVDEIASRAAAAQLAGAVRVQTDIEIILDNRGLSAQARLDALDSHTPWASSNALRFVGITDDLISLVREIAGHVDIVRFLPAVLDLELQELQFAVLPALLQDGTAKAPEVNASLHATLGLALPVNRYAAARL